MSEIKYSVRRGDSSQRPRRRRLRSLAFVPTLITIGNLLCGFAAIHFGLRAMYAMAAGATPDWPGHVDPDMLERLLPSFLSVGAGLVFLGMILDAMDGLIARVTRGTTNFGGQLDSLADIVTFGVAPAILMIAFITRELGGEVVVPSPLSPHLLGRVTWIAGALYVVFAAVRLARFNVEHAEVGFDYRTFRGLPSPAAAAIVAALILVPDQPEASGLVPTRVIVYTLPIVATAVAFLMVSRVPYRRLNRSDLVGRQPFSRLVLIVVVLAIFFAAKGLTLVAVTSCYVLSAPLDLLLRSIRGRRPAAAGAHPQRGGSGFRERRA
jgi:CDP-diacylglycerol--serine O-phosphatidyltransferase